MTDGKLCWGFLGTANIGPAAVDPSIQASANGELPAVAGRSEEKAREFALKAGIPESHAPEGP